jgi:hypothetical protein
VAGVSAFAAQLTDVAEVAAMESGPDGRSQADAMTPGTAEFAGAAMESGLGGRSQASPVAMSGSRITPQWGSASAPGLAVSSEVRTTPARAPKWSPALAAGVRVEQVAHAVGARAAMESGLGGRSLGRAGRPLGLLSCRDRNGVRPWRPGSACPESLPQRRT